MSLFCLQGYIDLSKRRVSPEDVAKCEDRYNKAKAVHSVLRHVADLRGLVLEDLSTKVSWPLYKKYGHAFDAFKLTLQDEEDVFVGLDIDEETKQAMITHIKRRLAPQPSKVRADIEVTCYTYEGIDAVKAALMAGKEVGDERTPIQIKLIAPPRYVMDTMTLDKDLGKSVLEKAIEVVTQSIVASGGKLEVRRKGSCSTCVCRSAEHLSYGAGVHVVWKTCSKSGGNGCSCTGLEHVACFFLLKQEQRLNL